MTQSASQPYRQQLKALMVKAGITSLQELSQRSQVSTWHLYRIQSGLLPKMALEHSVKIAQALQISLDELIAQFAPDAPPLPQKAIAAAPEQANADVLKQEYRRLEQQIEQQRESLTAQFQQASLDTIESWLLQWPTAVAAVEKNPEIPAAKLLNLVKPVNELLKQWAVEAIGTVGAAIDYAPQFHQLLDGEAEPGDRVWVRYVGYRQGEKLLYRAKVSPESPEIAVDSPKTSVSDCSEHEALTNTPEIEKLALIPPQSLNRESFPEKVSVDPAATLSDKIDTNEREFAPHFQDQAIEAKIIEEIAYFNPAGTENISKEDELNFYLEEATEIELDAIEGRFHHETFTEEDLGDREVETYFYD